MANGDGWRLDDKVQTNSVLICPRVFFTPSHLGQKRDAHRNSRQAKLAAN